MPRPAPLVWESDDGCLKFERRGERRESIKGDVSASYSDGAARFGITWLELVDRSSRGLGVWSEVPIDPGMRVEVRSGALGQAFLEATSVRCEAARGGFLIGLRLHIARAAA